MPGQPSDLHRRLRKLAGSGPVGPPRAAPPFDEEYLMRCLAYLLRHSSNDRGVALDSRGWTSVEEVVRATKRMHWSLGELTPGRLVDFVIRRAGDRFEVYGDRIRARYGHSVPGLAVAEPEIPPEVLFHGTSCDSLHSIHELGLLPMGRSHVHLTSDLDYARSVALTDGRSGVILVVEARRASEAGVPFLRAGAHVWLAGEIEAQFVREN